LAHKPLSPNLAGGVKKQFANRSAIRQTQEDDIALDVRS
jgi:hypothetical protein